MRNGPVAFENDPEVKDSRGRLTASRMVRPVESVTVKERAGFEGLGISGANWTCNVVFGGAETGETDAPWADRDETADLGGGIVDGGGGLVAGELDSEVATRL